MSGELDATGSLVAGALVASQFDAAAGKAGAKLSTCANCGSAIDGNFCANCGQSARLHRSIGHIVEELLHGILHFDGKGWRTLPMLAFQPGRLTRDYVEGKRARYVAPFAMFLFTVFVMYFTFAFIGGPAVDVDSAVEIDAESLADLRAEIRTAQAELAALETQRRAIEARADRAPGEGAGLSGEIAGQRAVLAALKAGLRRAEAAAETGDGTAVVAPSSIKDEIAKAARSANSDAVLIKGADSLNAKFRQALQNPDLLFYKMQQSAYKFSFLLVPLSLPFVWLLFPFRKGAHLYDHAVFTLYSLSFVTLLFVLATLLARTALLSAGTAVGLCFLLPPIHMFVQLKGAYQLSTLGALARALLLTLFAIIALSLFALAIAALGVI